MQNDSSLFSLVLLTSHCFPPAHSGQHLPNRALTAPGPSALSVGDFTQAALPS